jgi:cation transport ATPase
MLYLLWLCYYHRRHWCLLWRRTEIVHKILPRFKLLNGHFENLLLETSKSPLSNPKNKNKKQKQKKKQNKKRFLKMVKCMMITCLFLFTLIFSFDIIALLSISDILFYQLHFYKAWYTSLKLWTNTKIQALGILCILRCRMAQTQRLHITCHHLNQWTISVVLSITLLQSVIYIP